MPNKGLQQNEAEVCISLWTTREMRDTLNDVARRNRRTRSGQIMTWIDEALGREDREAAAREAAGRVLGA